MIVAVVKVAVGSNKWDDRGIGKPRIASAMEEKACWKHKYLVTGLLSSDKGGMVIKPCCKGWLHHAVLAGETPCCRGWFNSLTTNCRGYRWNIFRCAV